MMLTVVLSRVGEITVVIETKLDVRDGMAWSQLDKAIGRLEGSNAGDQREDQLNQDSDSETEIEAPGKIDAVQ